MHQVHLPLKMAILGLGCKSLADGGGDLATKLCGGGVGEGDDQKFVDILPLLLDPGHDPIHQHLCFAGTGSSGHQQGAAAIVYHSLLLGRQFHISHFPLLLPFRLPDPSDTRGQNRNSGRDRD